jgi:hypothetical protein
MNEEHDMMARLKKFLAATVAAAALTAALALPVLAHGAQTLPNAACNGGTATAHASLGSNAAGHDRIAHADHVDGSTCVHMNPTAGH